VDRLEDALALAIETGRRGCREDGIAFELDQREIRLDAFDDGVQEVARIEYAAGMPSLKSTPCSSSTPDMKAV
jgi:hypothetical protein